MDVNSTPPPRSPVGFFGESHYCWAPKKPNRPPKGDRDQKARSRRSLNFSSISMDEEIDENMGLKKTGDLGSRVHFFRREERNLHTPGRPVIASLAANRSIARRIDFTAITFSQNDPPERSSMSQRVYTTDPRRLLPELERPSGPVMKRQADEELSIVGNSMSGSKFPKITGVKKAKLTRLIR